MKRNKAFTLIELVSVLVILAILALIVTTIVLNIIKKARIAADKRSIDAYGRSIELAVADYLLDKGSFSTSIEELTIEYSGDEVVCSTTHLKDDGSVYLADCTVGGRTVLGYTYGKEETITYDAYSVGDEVTYNDVNYYVIEDSGVEESILKLLKAEPLSVEEVNQYGTGHTNMYVPSSESFYRQASDVNGYGGMGYFSSATCGYNGTSWNSSGCITDYTQSEIKYVVDAWKTAEAPAASEARLMTYEELVNDLGCIDNYCDSSSYNWIYNSNYTYWTMTPYYEYVYFVRDNGQLGSSGANYPTYVVRPVIVLNKSVLN